MTSLGERLRHDDDGAIMIFGIVMGAILVGALWHLASIGDAIFWRERAQDAADAAAFENAVWHARGMNLLVSLNLIMQVVLAVLVFWRIALLIAVIVVILSTLLCVFTFGLGCGATAVAVEYANHLRQVDKTISTVIMKTLGVMRVAQVAVSEATPALAFHFAASHTRDAYPGVTDATTWSASLIPSLSVKSLEEIKTCFSGIGVGGEGAEADAAATAGDSAGDQGTSSLADLSKKLVAARGVYDEWVATPRLSTPLSLPVQAAEYSTLCGKAGGLIVDVLGDVIGMIGPGLPKGALGRASGIVEGIVKSAPSVFCMPISETGPLKDALADLEGDIGTKCDGDLDKDPSLLVTGSDPDHPLYHEYGKEDGKPVTRSDWLEACKKDKTKSARDELNEAVEANNEGAEACGKPVEVWGFASNGNVFMRSFSSIRRAETMSARDARGIDMAEGGKGTLAAAQTDDVGAHAEMYFDCEGKWGECSEEAMWNLRWEARLRRVQPLVALASTAVEQVGVETLVKLADKGVSSALDGILHERVGIPPDIVPSVADNYLYEQLKNAGKEYLYEHVAGTPLDDVRKTILEHASSNSVIH